MCGGKRARDNAAMSKGRGGGILLPQYHPTVELPTKGSRRSQRRLRPHQLFTFRVSPSPSPPPFAIAGKFFCFGARGGEQEKGERKYKIMLYIEAK